MTTSRPQLKRKNRHYAPNGGKTLCGLVAISGEEVLDQRTTCKVCLREAVFLHFQLSNFAAKLLKDVKQ